MPIAEVALEQIRDNKPEVESGQVWGIIKPTTDYSYPHDLRIVCRYPFGEPEDGRVWIVEDGKVYSGLLRCPELTLRMLYEISKDVDQ